MMNRQPFVDLDGVMADFDGHYLALFGEPVRRDTRDAEADRRMWKNIASTPSFFSDLPVLPDALKLWAVVKQYHPAPIVLTGGFAKHENTAERKTEWVHKYIDPAAQVICTKSREKYTHGKPGDILIDDWEKYMQNWKDMGGIFILHKNLEDTTQQLRELYG